MKSSENCHCLTKSFSFSLNCHPNFSSTISFSYSHSFIDKHIYCIECVSLLMFSSFSSALFFSSLLSFFFSLGLACCLILWARFASGIRQNEQKREREEKKTLVLVFLLVTTWSVQNTSDNTNKTIQNEWKKIQEIPQSISFI